MSRSQTEALDPTKSPIGWLQRNSPVDKLQKGLPLSIIKINTKLQVMYLELCGFDIQKELF
jgi:hypothetical protein